MTPKKQIYRAIKYVWDPKWIGDDAYKKEIEAAQRACCSDILLDYQQDVGNLSEAQVTLTVAYIKKYAQCTVINIGDRCYRKVQLEVLL